MKRKVIMPTIALVAILGAMAIGTMPVSAQSPTYTNLVSKIAQRFNLNESDVQEVFNQVKTDRKKEMQTKWEERLSQLVTDGKITGAQKDIILAKRAEMTKVWEEVKSLSVSERQEKMKQLLSELKTWAQDNNIDLKLIGFGGKFGRSFKMGHWMGKNS